MMMASGLNKLRYMGGVCRVKVVEVGGWEVRLVRVVVFCHLYTSL